MRAPHADGLDAMEDRQLRSLATEWEVPTSGSRDELIERLRGVGATSPDARRAQVLGGTKPMPDKVIDAYDGLRAGRDTPWVSLTQLRSQLGGTREEQDAALMKLLRDKKIRLIPEENQKTITPADRAASLRVSGEDKHFIGITEPASTQRNGRAAQRLTSARSAGGDGLDAKRARLAELDAAAAAAPNTRESLRIRNSADELRQEIAHANDAGKIDQPREVTRAQITQQVAELVTRTGKPYVSLVRLRAALPHIKHDEVTAALKELDRARIIQLDPDSDQKNVPLEAYAAAVTIGGERKLLVSLIGGVSTGRAARRLRG